MRSYNLLDVAVHGYGSNMVFLAEEYPDSSDVEAGEEFPGEEVQAFKVVCSFGEEDRDERFYSDEVCRKDEHAADEEHGYSLVEADVFGEEDEDGEEEVGCSGDACRDEFYCLPVHGEHVALEGGGVEEGGDCMAGMDGDPGEEGMKDVVGYAASEKGDGEC